MATTLDVNKVWTRIEIDTDLAMNDLDAIASIRERLGRQLTLDVLINFLK